MTDPWVDARERYSERNYGFTYDVDENAVEDVGKLLTDAGALLAVARTGKALNLRYEPKLEMWVLMGDEAECEAFNKALSALPKHLK